jgi:hypothetical protein
LVVLKRPNAALLLPLKLLVKPLLLQTLWLFLLVLLGLTSLLWLPQPCLLHGDVPREQHVHRGELQA